MILDLSANSSLPDKSNFNAVSFVDMVFDEKTGNRLERRLFILVGSNTRQSAPLGFVFYLLNELVKPKRFLTS